MYVFRDRVIANIDVTYDTKPCCFNRRFHRNKRPSTFMNNVIAQTMSASSSLPFSAQNRLIYLP